MPGSGIITGIDFRAQDQAIRFGNPDIQNLPPPTIFAAGAQTLTAKMLLGSIIAGVPTASVNYTLDTTANILNALKAYSDALGVRIGDSFACMVANGSGGAFSITIVAGDGKTSVFKSGAITTGTNQVLNFYVNDPTGAATPSITVYG
jgi:hypothetical protein